MSPISRGFRGHRPQVDAARVPPGQHVVDDFPVLSAGPTPRTPLDEWTFEISGAIDEPVSWKWDELIALPAETPTADIHCVTAWSKLDTTWKGVSVDTLLAHVESEAEYVTAWCDSGYTTNLPLEDVTGGRAWIAYEFDGEPLDPEHGGPAWLLGSLRLPQPRRPVEGAALSGGLNPPGAVSGVVDTSYVTHTQHLREQHRER